MTPDASTRSSCIVLAGGGTGGHLVPGLAVADELRRRLSGARLVFIGAGRPIEERMIPRAGFELRILPTPRRPEKLLGWPLFPLRLWASVRRAKAALRELKPAIVVGLGGYGSFPAVLAAKKLGVPSVLLEQNSIPGRANRFLSRYAREIYAQFDASREYFRDPGRVRVLGNPLRRGITEGRRERAMQKFSLDPARRTLLVLGGSQGARTINEAVCDALGELAALGSVQVVHQTGSLDYDRAVERHRASGAKSWVAAFIDEMPDALAAADLILGRSGATTLAEIAAVGRPSVLVPYPYAADDHQRLNAQVYAGAGAAIVVRNEDLTGQYVLRIVKELMLDDKRLLRMGRAALSLARPDATRDVCNHILVILERAPS